MRILFAGYAPVHFLCFRPLYDMLNEMPDFDVRLSGGMRERIEGVDHFDHDALYAPLGIPPERVISAEEMRESDFDIQFGANTKLLPARSVGTRIQIFHGISFRNRAIRSANMNCDHYFLAGPYMRRRFAEAGLLPESDPRGLGIGFMKTDALLNGSLDREQLLRRYGLDGSRPVLAYCPTGQKHNSLATMGEEVLRELAATGRYDILIKLHDHPHGDTVDWPVQLAPMLDDHLKIVEDPDVIPVLALADLLITDASSVSSEYSLLDRPMVFLDVPKLLAKAARKDESMMDESTWGRKAGDIVETPDAVVAAVEAGLEHTERHAELRQAMAADLFYNPGRATAAAVEWLRSLDVEALQARSTGASAGVG